MTVQEALEAYHRASKAGAKVDNAACLVASKRRDEEYAVLRQSAQPDDCTVMLRIERKYDIACQKADKAYCLLLKEAHERLQHAHKDSSCQCSLCRGETRQLVLFA